MITPEAAGSALVESFSCILALPPLIVQVQQRNSACSILLSSTITFNFMSAVNAFIWSSADSNTWWDGHIFCDIQIRLFIGLEMAIIGAVASIFRQLSLVFDDSTRIRTKAQKRRTRIVEFLLCIAIPIFRMAAFYIVQPDRYTIIRQRGCISTFDTSWPGVLLMYGLQLLICVVALYYAALTSFRMFRHRQSTSSLLALAGNQPNEARTIRLYSFAILLFLTYVPLQIYALYTSMPKHLEPFSWSRIHPPNWSERIFKLRASVNPTYATMSYAVIFYTCAVAIIVSLAPDSIDAYKRWIVHFRNWTRQWKHENSTLSSSSDNLPSQNDRGQRAQIMDHYELEIISGSRRNQEVL